MSDFLHLLFESCIAVGALVGAVVSILSLRQSRRNTLQLDENKIAMDEQHKATNSRLTQLLTETAKAAQAEGHAKGVADERARM